MSLIGSIFFCIPIGIVLIIAISLIVGYTTNGKYHFHVPTGIGFNGASLKSECKKCGQKITQDSQGNWYV